MSRRIVKREDGGHLAVGWDPPLRSYYAQVYAPEPEGRCEDPECVAREYVGEHDLDQCQDNDPLVWFGAMPRAIPTIEGLELEMGADLWALLDDPLKRTLVADRQADR